MDISDVLPKDAIEYKTELNKLNYRQSQKFINYMLDKCFNLCVNSFLSTELGGGEEKCSENCIRKFLKISSRSTDRLSERFGYINENQSK